MWLLVYTDILFCNVYCTFCRILMLSSHISSLLYILIKIDVPFTDFSCLCIVYCIFFPKFAVPFTHISCYVKFIVYFDKIWRSVCTCLLVVQCLLYIFTKLNIDRGCRGHDPWSYDNWNDNYLCNQCLSPLMLWIRISIRARWTTLCDNICQWLATGRWFSPGTPVSSTNKTDCHGITEILLKVAWNTMKQTNKTSIEIFYICLLFM